MATGRLTRAHQPVRGVAGPGAGSGQHEQLGALGQALAEAVGDGRIQRGQLLLFEAFGAGFTWGSALVRF